ncbi:hypothetical protein [Streptomyces sp. SID13031]|uniref:hypothetical protein n=1 Tax=Streptomyces sp. SID13031 TaxID=2706046 RepID=UPI0013C5C301|nr:hypothetical protein [Streptomyces sp. SID13031]NEA30978.1 hypothetical protein [Streptomyces sp. SID13031]
MRTRRRSPIDDTRYCVLCDDVVPFELVQTGDHPTDDLADEWICVACGSALLIGPPAQPDQYAHPRRTSA